MALVGGACKGPAASPSPSAPTAVASAEPAANVALAPTAANDASTAGAEEDVAPAPEQPRPTGPYEIPFAKDRSVYFAVPSKKAPGQRLIANLHGMCNPPGYACGYWVHAGSEHGFLVCPRGNAECAPGVSTWTESWAKIDDDLEASIAAVDAAYPDEIDRDRGSILTGFSLGASVAPLIAEKHPGRWRYLVLVEATVALDPAKLRAAGVRGVALVAGEIGGNAYGERAIAESLARQGFPARFWVMPKAGHWYSANIDALMGEAIDWLLAQGDGDAAAP